MIKCNSEVRQRVLQIVETLDVGGMERMVETLCRTLDPEEHEVRVLVTRKRGAIGESLAQYGITVDCLGLRQVGSDYLAIRDVVSYMRRFQPHAVHTHGTHALIYGGIAARLCNVPAIVHTEHGRVFPDKPHIMAFERWFSRYLVRYVAVSQQLRDEVHRYLQIPDSRTAFIPNGVADPQQPEPSAVSMFREALVGHRSGPIVGVAARLVWEKGLDVLLRAWAARDTTPDFRGTLVIVGEGPERRKLEQLALDLGISDSVVLPGVVSDVASFYRMIDLFVMSSVSEGLPMALLEAMAAGRPIVATRVGGIASALGEGKAGIVVEPHDHEALAEAIDSLIGRSKRFNAELLADAARERFLTTFTARVMADNYASLYSTALSGFRV